MSAQEKVIVHFNLYRPDKSSFFKPVQNGRALVQLITCTNSNACTLLTSGTCACCYGNKKCPYGEYLRVTGYTVRAKKYHTWCNDMKKRYSGVPFLKPPKKIGLAGNYVFLPYAHMDMLKDLPWVYNVFLDHLILTPENVVKLAEFVPYTLYDYKEITSYQKETVPKFLKHLSEFAPKLFQEAAAKSLHVTERYHKFSNVGREAILESITPNIGQLIDIHGRKWTWDGKALHSLRNNASFLLVDKIIELIVIPEPGQSVEITDERQVNQETIFME